MCEICIKFDGVAGEERGKYRRKYRKKKEDYFNGKIYCSIKIPM